MTIIDAFAHVFPRSLVDTVQQLAPASDLGSLLAQTPHMYDSDLRLAFLDEQHIDRQVLTLAYPHILEHMLTLSRHELHTITRALNEAIAAFAARRPDRFIGVGVLPDVDEVLVAELERMRNELHLKGVLISSNIDGQPLDTAKMWPLYERAAALDFPIWIHPANARYYPWLNPRERMFMILGWPFETTLAMASLVFGGVLKRYPTLKVIVHHAGGGMVPFYYERIKSYLDSDSASIALPENEQRVDPGDFTRFYVDTVVNGSQAALQCSLALFGADHMLFGTDFPFGPKGGESWLPRVLQSVRELDVSQRDREKIFSGNASLLLHL